MGSIDTPDLAADVAVSGNHTYVADYSSGLQIVDVSSPASPAIVGAVDTPGWAIGVAVSGGYAYVGDAASGLQVVDVSNSAAPAIVGGVDTPDETSGVAVSGSCSYVADGYSGLHVVDVSNLQRQILHDTGRIGAAKAESAAMTLARLNPEVAVDARRDRVTAATIEGLAEGCDAIVPQASCGLGFEPALILPVLMGLRRRRRPGGRP